MAIKRRDFLRATAASAAGLSMRRRLMAAETKKEEPSSNAPALPKRPYGKEGIMISVIGLGGIVVSGAEQAHANRVVAEAVERGVNYFDVAPTYGDAELKLGPALEPYRKNTFLACKTTERSREKAEFELNRSLERLRTDHLDLYQLHALTDLKKDVDAAFGKGGAMEVFIQAKKEGRVRHLGFSAHSVAAALAAMDRYDFDSILFPVNFVTYYKADFGPQVIKVAKKKGLTILALKAMARQQWPKGDPTRKQYGKCWYQPLSDPREAELGLRFTLSQGVTAAIPPGEESLFRLALEIAPKIKPITLKETKELQALAADLKPIFAA